jgi:hypothetical protein
MRHFAVAVMPPDEKPHPMQVNLFGVEVTVQVTNTPAKLIQQPRERKTGVQDFMVYL